MASATKIPMNNEPPQDWPIDEEEGELAIDLYETKDELVLQTAIAGVKSSDLDISITNDMITIKGKRERSEGKNIEKIYYNECFWGPFSRALVLPKEIEVDKAKAVLKNGLLTIKLPKLEKSKQKVLKIQEE